MLVHLSWQSLAANAAQTSINRALRVFILPDVFVLGPRKRGKQARVHIKSRPNRPQVHTSHVSLQSLVGCAGKSARICTGSARSLDSCCVLFGCLALRDDEVHVGVDSEADDFLVERLTQTTWLEVEAKEGLQ